MASPPVELPLSQAVKSAAALRTANIAATIDGELLKSDSVWSPSCRVKLHGWLARTVLTPKILLSLAIKTHEAECHL